MTGEYHGNGSHPGPTRTQTDGRANKPPLFHLLVMGAQGCGKSSFINSATEQTDCITAPHSKLCTKVVRSCRHSKWINGSEFKFIDTPGFGNDVIDNRGIFERLLEFLAPNPRYEGPSLPRRITGLLYIHSEDEPFKGRASHKAIAMLVKILGEQFLDRVTVLIRSQSKPVNDISSFMPSEDSPLYPLYRNATKPWTMEYKQDPKSIENILGPYTSLYPRGVRIAVLENFAQRDGNNWQYDNIHRHLREYFPEDIGPPVSTNQPDVQQRFQEQENEIEKLRGSLAQREKEFQDLRSAHDNELQNLREKIQTEKSDHELNLKSLYNMIRDREGEILKLKSEKDSELKEIEELKEKVKRVESGKDEEIAELESKLDVKNEEISVLRTDSERRIQKSMAEVQAKENEITELKARIDGGPTKANSNQASEISRLNEEIRRTKAEYASLRNNMQLEENTEQADITTALGDINRLIEEFGQSLAEHVETHIEKNSPETAIQSQDLLNLFGPVGGELASKLKQVDAYVLLEYIIQATICDQLSSRLFKPFHPSIAEDRKRNTFITRVYEQISQEVPQSVSGRWRKDTFNSISKHPELGKQETPDVKRIHQFITEALSALLTKVAKVQPVEILKKHNRALIKVTTKAEDLNKLLKGDISMLGDYQPIVFPFGEAFRPERMSEVDSKSRGGRYPERILATVELGLVKRYALGGGRKPEETVLRRVGVFGLPSNQ